MNDKRVYELHADVCKTMSNPKRLEIINLLRNGEMSVEELASKMDIRTANLSQHLAVMRNKKIVETRRNGLKVYYKIANPKVVKACDIMREVLMEQLADGQKFMEKIKNNG
ncbi:Bacterial regulatory protein, arsR family [uncultured archaeon]|nr:Bacterial regulatory protein, arsR family [uncultured archaeon]